MSRSGLVYDVDVFMLCVSDVLATVEQWTPQGNFNRYNGPHKGISLGYNGLRKGISIGTMDPTRQFQ